jgi:hypothetical protein
MGYGVFHRGRGRRDTATNPTAKSAINSAQAENTIASVGLLCSVIVVVVGAAAGVGATDPDAVTPPRAASRASGERGSTRGAAWTGVTAAGAAFWNEGSFWSLRA